MNRPSDTHRNGASGKRFLWLIAGFAGLILVANGAMVVFALTSWTGLEAEEPYIQGLNYNDELAQRAAQEALGWRLGVDSRQVAPGQLRLAVTPVDDEDRLLTGIEVTGTLVRPTQEGNDVSFQLGPAGAAYEGDIAVPLPGVWDLHLTVARGDDVLRHHERLYLDP